MRELTERIDSDVAKESVRKMKEQISYVKSKRGNVCCKIEMQCSQALSDQLVQVAKGGSVWLILIYIVLFSLTFFHLSPTVVLYLLLSVITLVFGIPSYYIFITKNYVGFIEKVFKVSN